jgi:hypothetical protein
MTEHYCGPGPGYNKLASEPGVNKDARRERDDECEEEA